MARHLRLTTSPSARSCWRAGGGPRAKEWAYRLDQRALAISFIMAELAMDEATSASLPAASPVTLVDLRRDVRLAIISSFMANFGGFLGHDCEIEVSFHSPQSRLCCRKGLLVSGKACQHARRRHLRSNELMACLSTFTEARGRPLGNRLATVCSRLCEQARLLALAREDDQVRCHHCPFKIQAPVDVECTARRRTFLDCAASSCGGRGNGPSSATTAWKATAREALCHGNHSPRQTKCVPL